MNLRWTLFWQHQRAAWRVLRIRPIRNVEELAIGELTDKEADAFIEAITRDA